MHITESTPIVSQTFDNAKFATFDRLPISNAVCKMGSEKCPADANHCDDNRDKNCEAYRSI